MRVQVAVAGEQRLQQQRPQAALLACMRRRLCRRTRAGRSKGRKDKAERLASVMAGREGREAYGAKAKTKKQKSGGLSERQKQRSKAMPIAARIAQLRNRAAKSRNKSNPRHFKGHVRKK